VLREVARIVALPVLPPIEQRAAPFGQGLHLAGSPRTLRPIQVAALGEAQRAGGLLGIIGVGQGKFLISVLAASVIRCERPLLLVPPALVEQTRTELLEWSQHVRIHPNLLVMSYNDLSTVGGQARLTDAAPDLIIADEVHHLRREGSARTRRLMRWFIDHPTTRFVGLSGTMSSRSVLDYDHIAELALRERSPLPTEWVEAEAWAAVLDPGGEPTVHQVAAVAPLLKAFPAPTPAASLHARLSSAPGVVCTVDTSAAQCSLRVEMRRFVPPAALKEAMRVLRTTWTLPDGTELLRACEFAAAVKQLQVGFYYVWDWNSLGGKNEQWLAARAAWARVVRVLLERGLSEVDSPLQVEQYVQAKGTRSQQEALELWLAIADTVTPPVATRWVSHDVIDHVLDRLDVLEQERGPVLVWCEHRATLEALEDSGVRVLRPGDAVPTVPITLALPRHSFGVGKNLQAWNTSLVLEPTASGTTWEQLIGRTHREGQQADDVLLEVPFWDGMALVYLKSALEDAQYVQDSTGQKQKLLLASTTHPANFL